MSRADHYGGHWIRESTRELIHERDGWRCLWCGTPVKRRSADPETQATLDHVLPRGKGNHHPSNLITACADCNSRRRDRIAVDFAFNNANSGLPAYEVLSRIVEAMGTPIRPESLTERIVSKVAESPGLTATQIARALKASPATVSATLNRLARTGRVRVRTLPALRRRVFTTKEAA